MDAKYFASLFESVRQMDEIVHGVREASREFHIDALGVTGIRKAAGLSQALSGEGNPSLANTMKVAKALGFRLALVPDRD